MSTPSVPAPGRPVASLRRVVLAVAAANLLYGLIEAAVGLRIGSVSLLADAADFGEDAAINLLVALALGWSAQRRRATGRVLALIVLVPAAVAGWELLGKLGDPVAPAAGALTLTAAGAALVNLGCALALVRVRSHGGSLTAAAWYAARNDVLINVLVIAVGSLTAATGSVLPDAVAGALMILLGLHAAWEVWEAAEGEEDDAADAADGGAGAGAAPGARA